MRLLLDQNLSHRLVGPLSHVFPGTTHVRLVGLERASDDAVWRYAKDNGYVIVSKDSDFHQRSLVEGLPPKVVWIQRGNCRTSEIELLMARNADALRAFALDPHATFLELA